MADLVTQIARDFSARALDDIAHSAIYRATLLEREVERRAGDAPSLDTVRHKLLARRLRELADACGAVVEYQTPEG